MSRQRLKLEATLLSVLITSQIQQALTTHEKPLSPDAWQGICDVTAVIRSRLDETEAYLAQRVNQATAAALRNARTQLLLARANDNEERRKLQVVAAAMATRAARAQRALTEAQTIKLTKAIKTAAYFLGHVDEYFTTAATAVQAGTKGCITNTHGGTDFTTYEQIKSTYQNCKAATLTEKQTWNTDKGRTDGGYKNLNAIVNKVGASEKGCRLHSLENSNGILNGNPTQTTAHLAGGLLTITAAGPELKDLTSIANKEDQPGYSLLKQVHEHTDSALHLPDDETDYPTKADLLKEESFVTAFRAAFNLSKDISQEELKNKVDFIYGATDDAIKQSIWKKLSVLRAAVNDQGEPEGPSIAEITDLALLVQLAGEAGAKREAADIDRLNAKNSRPHTCTSNNTADAQNQRCSALGDDELRCNAQEQCSYDGSKEVGKKCTYNATKAAANGAPVTQAQTVGETEATPEKCKGKDAKTCGTTQGCKWEGETCKDSSILVTKKFALTVVSAAFVALLF
uniref:Variant surface glycoprotein 417 n=1 Tax=Trypanosoma brucei TaxID=5691 RepID=M4T009_9TRYP|nr:variant surface glycoprotein 417 [Trypanosoma brucei]